jgi:hypothetical protein
MVKRAILVLAAVIAVAGVLAFTVSPISPTVAWAALTAAQIKEGPNKPAPHSAKQALTILKADVTKIASDYSHKRFRSVCADLTKNERKQLGGTSKCMLKMAVLQAFMPVKKITIAKAKLTKRNARATVDVYLDGIKKHLVHAFVKWEGGAYRLDHQSGWHP